MTLNPIYESFHGEPARGLKMRLFISHASGDHGMAEELSAALGKVSAAKNVPLSVFVDRTEIEQGSNWKEELRRHLKEADVVAVLVSPFSVTSAQVAFEIGAAE